MDSHTPDRLVQELHDLAELPSDQLVKRYDVGRCRWLGDLVRLCVPTQCVPTDLTPEEFALWIADLRENERAWNRRLGTLLLEVESDTKSGARTNALDRVRGFLKDCPWVPLKEIAQTELERLGRT